jgi:hypothetical protein
MTQKRRALVLAAVEEHADVAVQQRARGLRFLPELAAIVLVVGTEHLDSDLAANRRIACEVDHAHPAAPEKAFDFVAADGRSLRTRNWRRERSGGHGYLLRVRLRAGGWRCHNDRTRRTM